MAALDDIKRELVLANRILAREDVVDAYGHVSVRHPDDPSRYLLSRSRAPELVEVSDIMEFALDGTPVGDTKMQPYLERFIHGAIYEARPDVMAVVHAHAEDTLPFGIAGAQKLVPVIHSGAFIGGTVPVWTSPTCRRRDEPPVTNVAQGRDMAKTLADGRVSLMRGHGFAAAAPTLIDVVRLSVYLPRNARVQMNAMRIGEFKPLSAGEIGERAGGDATYAANSLATWRAGVLGVPREVRGCWGCGRRRKERPRSTAIAAPPLGSAGGLGVVRRPVTARNDR